MSPKLAVVASRLRLKAASGSPDMGVAMPSPSSKTAMGLATPPIPFGPSSSSKLLRLFLYSTDEVTSSNP